MKIINQLNFFTKPLCLKFVIDILYLNTVNFQNIIIQIVTQRLILDIDIAIFDKLNWKYSNLAFCLFSKMFDEDLWSGFRVKYYEFSKEILILWTDIDSLLRRIGAGASIIKVKLTSTFSTSYIAINYTCFIQ